MPVTLFDSGEKERKKAGRPLSSVLTGTVINNCDLISQGKVLVRIPALDQEVWARLSSVGAGSSAGFFYVPRPDDEVLVALNDNEPEDAFIIGGLWNTRDSPPVSNPIESTTKRVIKTGVVGGLGHTVEFDDGPGQSITISTPLGQKVVIDPLKIELSTIGGTCKVTLDVKKQTISIDGPLIEIGGGKTARVSIKGKVIEIGDKGNIGTSVQGKIVMIN